MKSDAGGTIASFSPDSRGLQSKPRASQHCWRKELAMPRRNLWFMIVALTSVSWFGGSASADDPKAEPDKRPRLVAQLGHTGFVNCGIFSPDGKQLLTGSWDKTARLWDTQSGKELRTFMGHDDWVIAVAFSPDGKQVLTGSSDKSARLWDVRSGQELRAFAGHSGAVDSVAFSRDGKQVLTG